MFSKLTFLFYGLLNSVRWELQGSDILSRQWVHGVYYLGALFWQFGLRNWFRHRTGRSWTRSWNINRKGPFWYVSISRCGIIILLSVTCKWMVLSLLLTADRAFEFGYNCESEQELERTFGFCWSKVSDFSFSFRIFTVSIPSLHVFFTVKHLWSAMNQK